MLILHSQERVEEARFVRAMEQQYIKKKQEELAAAAEVQSREVLSPVMAEVQTLLSKTGDSISALALENIAKWKLGN